MKIEFILELQNIKRNYLLVIYISSPPTVLTIYTIFMHLSFLSNNNSVIDCVPKRIKRFSKAHESIKYLRWSYTFIAFNCFSKKVLSKVFHEI